MEVPFSYHNILLVAMIFGCHSFVKINFEQKYKDLQLEILLVIVQFLRLYGHYLKVDIIYHCQHMRMEIECAQQRNGTKI